MTIFPNLFWHQKKTTHQKRLMPRARRYPCIKANARKHNEILSDRQEIKRIFLRTVRKEVPFSRHAFSRSPRMSFWRLYEQAKTQESWFEQYFRVTSPYWRNPTKGEMLPGAAARCVAVKIFEGMTEEENEDPPTTALHSAHTGLEANLSRGLTPP